MNISSFLDEKCKLSVKQIPRKTEDFINDIGVRIYIFIYFAKNIIYNENIYCHWGILCFHNVEKAYNYNFELKICTEIAIFLMISLEKIFKAVVTSKLHAVIFTFSYFKM